MKRKDLWVYGVTALLAGMMFSCQISDRELGEDLLPPGDATLLFHDTIFEIDAYSVSGQPAITSEIKGSYNSDRLMLLGNLQDTIVGSSKAEVITQFNTTTLFKSAPNTVVDTLMLSLYIKDWMGDMSREMHISVHEFTDRIYMDSLYWSDYTVEGRFNPVPLAEKTILPQNEVTLDFLIDDQDFIDKFLSVANDTNYFRNDSLFKDYFNGLYITAESASPEGAMARIHLANFESRLSMRYSNDSTDVDSTAERDFSWARFPINEYYSQKINLFEHDHTGTYLSEIIDDENAASPYLYVQGMTGVNIRFSFATLEEWIAQGPMAINQATLVLDIVPEEESGIPYEDLPERLMLGTILPDNTIEPIYDFILIHKSDPEDTQFGGRKQAESKGMFADTTYSYRFNIGLHFQSLVDGDKADNDFIMQLIDYRVNPKVSKLWSNLPTNNQRIRLEVAYLKL